MVSHLLEVIRHLEMRMQRTCADPLLFLIKDVSIIGFGDHEEALETNPMDTEA